MFRTSESLGQITTGYGPSVGELSTEDKCDPQEDDSCRPKTIDKVRSTCVLKSIRSCVDKSGDALSYVKLGFNDDVGCENLVTSVDSGNTSTKGSCNNLNVEGDISSFQWFQKPDKTITGFTMWTNQGKKYIAGSANPAHAQTAFEGKGLNRLVGFSTT